MKKWVTDVKELDLDKYDVVITDYEPVTACAAKLRNKPSIGIGHQYAFCDDIPMKGFSKLTLAAMRHFAPAKTHLGLHWHHFGHQIIPPIVPLPDTTKETILKKIVVYLYLENQQKLEGILRKFPDYQFYVYSPFIKTASDEANLHMRPASDQFKHDVENCEGVICGAGFELPTEVIHLGKKLLVKEVNGHPEQASNAFAIEELGLGMAMTKLEEDKIAEWLEAPHQQRILFPDAAQDVADWIAKRDWKNTESLVQGLWDKTFGYK